MNTNRLFWDELAIQAYKDILKKNPQCALAHMNLGIAYARVGRSNKGIRSLQKALKIDKSLVDAYYHLGCLYQESGKTVEALRCFKNYERRHSQKQRKSQVVPTLIDYLTKEVDE